MTDQFVNAIVGHLVGDYLLQNDWMAIHKKRGWFRCAIHCLIWTYSVMLFGNLWRTEWVFTFLFVTHFAQDHTDIIARWMDAIGQKQFRTGPCAPWSLIVVDNVWHIVALWVAVRFIA